MKLNRIEITNFQGLRDARLSLNKPVTLVSGKNGAGKSTLLEAVRLALLGNPERVSLKKNLSELVTDGAKKGGIDVTTGNQMHFAYSLPEGKHQQGTDLGPYIGYVLDAQNFARTTADARRSTLFALTGCKVSSEEVGKRLAQRKAPQAKIDLVLPMLRSGFPAACTMAKEQATQSKGSWRAVTNETYGPQKAESWAPAAVDPVSAADLSNAQVAVSGLESKHSELDQALGAARTQVKQAQDAAASIQALKDEAGNFNRRKEKLTVDQAELDKWESKVAEAKAASNPPAKINKPAARLDSALLDAFAIVTSEFVGLTQKSRGIVNDYGVCESWDQHARLITRADAHLSTYKAQHGEPLTQGQEEPPAPTGPKLSDIEASRDIYRRAVDNDRRDIAAAEHAAQQLALMGEHAASANYVDIPALESELKAIQAKLQSARDAVTSLNAQQAACKAAQDAEAKALAHHADVMQWTAIAEALAPDGIPSEILSGALRPANDYLHELATFANWMRVQIGTEMEITADGRPYALLSESEKWRCDCLLSLMIAKLSGLKLVLLDRFDVLDMAGRGDVIDLLDYLAERLEIDTAVICGTLKQAPTGLPETFETIWIENGEINNLKLDGEQAA